MPSEKAGGTSSARGWAACPAAPEPSPWLCPPQTPRTRCVVAAKAVDELNVQECLVDGHLRRQCMDGARTALDIGGGGGSGACPGGQWHRQRRLAVGDGGNRRPGRTLADETPHPFKGAPVQRRLHVRRPPLVVGKQIWRKPLPQAVSVLLYAALVRLRYDSWQRQGRGVSRWRAGRSEPESAAARKSMAAALGPQPEGRHSSPPGQRGQSSGRRGAQTAPAGGVHGAAEGAVGRLAERRVGSKMGALKKSI